MTQPHKILTVSYGTFSCTLEGFEDSFDTMKAIAEYFRDLAADDRYFGAEPPTPDAEMLARIAEKEIARRVEAHQDREGIHLRAAAIAAPVAAPVADAAPAAPVAAPAASVASEDFDDEDFAEDEAILAEDDDEILAEAEEEEKFEDDDFEIAADADDEDADLADSADAALSEEDEVDAAAPAPDLSAIMAETVTSEPAPAPAPAPKAAAPAAPDVSSVAAKLARIRQVVSQKPAPRNDGFTEDEHAATTEPDAPEADETEAEAAAPADTLANVMDQLRADAAPEAAKAPAPQAEAAPAPKAAAAPMTARVLKVKRKVFDQAVSAGMLEEVDESPAPAPAPAAKAARVPSSLSEDDEADLQAALAEVAAELDSDAPGAPGPEADDTLAADASLADDDAYDFDDDQDEFEDEDGFDDEDDELDRAEYDADESDDEDEDEDVAAPAPQGGGRDLLMQSGISARDADVSRLLDKAASEMSEPAGRQRRNAISHLRAAMAATRDDQDLTRGTDTEAGSAVYREDLDEVVRPRRPVAQGASRAERPAEVKTAPLQLVAEQRVDKGEGAGQPVRPRRVSTLAAIAEDDEEMEIDADMSFAEFAEEMGASDLPDLLEAAAAYMSFVEKRPAFSRPQLMTKVRSLEAVDYTREDRLRSFGVLLREGKIQKTQGGQFTASDRISYRPDEDRAAG